MVLWLPCICLLIAAVAVSQLVMQRNFVIASYHWSSCIGPLISCYEVMIEVCVLVALIAGSHTLGERLCFMIGE